MDIKIQKALRRAPVADAVHLFTAVKELKEAKLTKDELAYLRKELKLKRTVVEINRFRQKLVMVQVKYDGPKNSVYEALRKQGNEALAVFNKNKSEHVVVYSSEAKEITLAFMEGMLLGNYQFIKYLKNADEKENSVKEISIWSKKVSDEDIEDVSAFIATLKTDEENATKQ